MPEAQAPLERHTCGRIHVTDIVGDLIMDKGANCAHYFDLTKTPMHIVPGLYWVGLQKKYEPSSIADPFPSLILIEIELLVVRA